MYIKLYENNEMKQSTKSIANKLNTEINIIKTEIEGKQGH